MKNRLIFIYHCDWQFMHVHISHFPLPATTYVYYVICLFNLPPICEWHVFSVAIQFVNFARVIYCKNGVDSCRQSPTIFHTKRRDRASIEHNEEKKMITKWLNFPLKVDKSDAMKHFLLVSWSLLPIAGYLYLFHIFFRCHLSKGNEFNVVLVLIACHLCVCERLTMQRWPRISYQLIRFRSRFSWVSDNKK